MERDENLEYTLLEGQRSNNFSHSLRSFQTRKGWKQKLGYCVFSILVLICMLTVTSVILHKTGKPKTAEASVKKFLPDIEIDVSTSTNSSSKFNTTSIYNNETTVSTTTTTTVWHVPEGTDVETILNSKWRQYDGINIAEYLKVEGGDPFYRSMAERSEPLLSFQRKGPGEYTQSFKVFFVTKKYPLDFNKEYAHEDGIGTKCLSTAEIVGDTISIRTLGGKKGPVVTTYSLKDHNDLWIVQDMIEEKITNSRIYKRENS